MTQSTATNRERWVPRCPRCHNGHIIVAPSPCNPSESENFPWPWNVYCIECGAILPIAEVVYVRL